MARIPESLESEVNEGDIIRLGRINGKLEVCGFVDGFDPKKRRVNLSMVCYKKPLKGSLAFVNHLLFNNDFVYGPSKWYRLSDFEIYHLIEAWEQRAPEHGDMVSFFTPQASAIVCGYFKKDEGEDIQLSMASPFNSSHGVGLLTWMRVGREGPHCSYIKESPEFMRQMEQDPSLRDFQYGDINPESVMVLRPARFREP